MPGEAAGDDVDGIDSDVVAFALVSGRKRFGGGGHSAEAVVVEGEVGLGGGCSGFYLDKGEDPAAPCHQVHLAAWSADPAADHAPALELQPERCESLGAPSATLGALPFHQGRFI